MNELIQDGSGWRGNSFRHSFQQLPRNHFSLTGLDSQSRLANLRNLQTTNKNENN
jgi:hypothetical protein